MTDTLEHPLEQQQAPHTTSGRAERTALRFMLCFFIPCVVIYLLPYAAERMPLLQPRSASNWGLILDHSYNLADTNADVVIFGDSSALYGIDTPRLSAELGLKVINLPQSIGSLVVTGSDPLRRYLAGNRPPRLIVFYFAPWNTNFNEVKDARSYEGIELLARHGSEAQFLNAARAHRRSVILFPLQYYLVPSGITAPWAGTQDETPTVHAGFLPYPAHLAHPLDAQCALFPEAIKSHSTASLQAIQRDFQQSGMNILAVMAPVPHCKGAEVLQSRLGSSLDVLPASDFASDEEMVHPLAEHVGDFTERLAGILRANLQAAEPPR